tara:strand:+ start:823 stop:9645 length:8823 start_codon:yes stop_codon:yes gene_type:complete
MQQRNLTDIERSILQDIVARKQSKFPDQMMRNILSPETPDVSRLTSGPSMPPQPFRPEALDAGSVRIPANTPGYKRGAAVNVNPELFGLSDREDNLTALMGSDGAKMFHYQTNGGSIQNNLRTAGSYISARLRQDLLQTQLYNYGDPKNQLEQINAVADALATGSWDGTEAAESLAQIPEDDPIRQLANIQRLQPALFNKSDNPYKEHGGEIYFDHRRMPEGIEKAKQDGKIDEETYNKLIQNATEFENELLKNFGQDQLDMIRASEDKALAYGVTKGLVGFSTFAVGAKAWGKTFGKTAGIAAGKVPKIGPLLRPVVETSTGIAAGWLASAAASLTLDEATEKMGEYYEIAAKFAASKDMYPEAAATGEFIGFAVPMSAAVGPGLINVAKAVGIAKGPGAIGVGELGKMAGLSALGSGTAYTTIRGLEETAIATGVTETPIEEATTMDEAVGLATFMLLGFGFTGKNLKFGSVRVTPKELAEHIAVQARGPRNQQKEGIIPSTRRTDIVTGAVPLRTPSGRSGRPVAAERRTRTLKEQAMDLFLRDLNKFQVKWRKNNPNATPEQERAAFMEAWNKLPANIDVKTISMGDYAIAGQVKKGGVVSQPTGPQVTARTPAGSRPMPKQTPGLPAGTGRPRRLPQPVEAIRQPPATRKGLPEPKPRSPIITPFKKRPELPGSEAMWNKQLEEGRTPGQVSVGERTAPAAIEKPAAKPVAVAEAEKPLELWDITKSPSGVQAGSEIVVGKASQEAINYGMSREEEPPSGTRVTVDRVEDGVVYATDKAGDPVTVDTSLTEVMTSPTAASKQPPVQKTEKPTAQEPIAIERPDPVNSVTTDYYPNAKVGNDISVYDIDGNKRTARVSRVSDAGNMRVEFVNSTGEVVTEAIVGISAIAQPINPKNPNFEIVSVQNSGLEKFEGRKIESLSDRELQTVGEIAKTHLERINPEGVELSPIQIKQGKNKFGEQPPILNTRLITAAVKAEKARRKQIATAPTETQPASAGIASTPKLVPSAPQAPAVITKSKTEPIRSFSTFSGMGTMESALTSVTHQGAIEVEDSIVSYYNLQHGTQFGARDIMTVKASEIRKQNPDLFHASPVCKSFSDSKKSRKVLQIDKDHANKVAELIKGAAPPSVTMENVPRYFASELGETITAALVDAGYEYRLVASNAAEYGAVQNRNRVILQAVRKDVGELPVLPEKREPGDWYEAIKDLIDDAPYSPMRGKTKKDLNWELYELTKRVLKGVIDPTKPLITMGGSAGGSVPNFSMAGGPAPTLKATVKEVPRIIMPDGRVKRVTPRMMARLMGLSDEVKIPEKWADAKTVLGNGIHAAHTQALIEPVAQVATQSRKGKPAEPKTKQEAAVAKVVEKAKAKKKPATIKLPEDKLSWKSKGKGEWRSQDGRFKVVKTEGRPGVITYRGAKASKKKSGGTPATYRVFGTRGKAASKPIVGEAFTRLSDAKEAAETFRSGLYTQIKRSKAKAEKAAEKTAAIEAAKPPVPKYDIPTIKAERQQVESQGIKQKNVSRTAPKIRQWTDLQGLTKNVPRYAVSTGSPSPELSSYEEYLYLMRSMASQQGLTASSLEGRQVVEVSATDLSIGDTFGFSGAEFHVIERITAGELMLAQPEESKEILHSQFSTKDVYADPIRPGDEYLVVATPVSAFVIPTAAKMLMAEGNLERGQENPFAIKDTGVDTSGLDIQDRTPGKISSDKNKSTWQEMVKPQDPGQWPAEARQQLEKEIISPLNELPPKYHTMVSEWKYLGEYKGDEQRMFPLDGSNVIHEFAHPISGRSVLTSDFGWVDLKNNQLVLTPTQQQKEVMERVAINLNERPILAELMTPRRLHAMGAMANPGGFKSAKERAESMRAQGRQSVDTSATKEQVYEVIPNEETRARIEKSGLGFGKLLEYREKQGAIFEGVVDGFRKYFGGRGSVSELGRERGGPAAFYAIARDRIEKLPSLWSITQKNSVETLKGIVSHLTEDQYTLFNHHLLFRDLAESIKKHAGQGEESEYQLPYGLTEADVKRVDEMYTDMANKDVDVLAAVEHRRDIQERVKASLIDAGKRAGYPELEQILNRVDYYQHQNIEKRKQIMLEEMSGKKVSLPNRGQYKVRKGSESDINSNFVEVEASTLQKMMYDTVLMDTIADLRSEYDISRMLKKRAEVFNKELEAEAARLGVSVKAKDYAHWTDYKKEYPGYENWALRGSVQISGRNTDSQAFALETFEQFMSQRFGLTKEEMASAQGMEDSANVMFIPKPLANQLHAIQDQYKKLAGRNKFLKLNSKMNSIWKRFVLQGPSSFVGYNIRNAVEMEKAFWAAPKGMLQIPAAAKELTQSMLKGVQTEDLADWISMGGGVELTAGGELPDVKQIVNVQEGIKGSISNYFSQGAKDIAVKAVTFDPWWRSVGAITNLRESITRYSMYKHLVAEIRADRDRVRAENPTLETYKGRPKSFMGSIPEEVLAMNTPQEMAWKLSNEMFINYGAAGPVTKTLADKGYMPFIRFQTGNNMWYFRYIKNTLMHPKVQREAAIQLGLPPGTPPPGDGTGRGRAASVAGATARLGVSNIPAATRLGLQLAGMYAGTSALATIYNNMFFDDIEEQLPDDMRRQFHIILGRDKDGRPRIFFGGSTSSEVLRGMGINSETPGDLMKILYGEDNITRFAEELGVNVGNFWGQQAGPTIGITMSLLGLESYPDLFNLRRVGDRTLSVFRQLGLGEEYAAIAGKPSRWADRHLGGEDILYRTTLPGEYAYNRIRDEAKEFRTDVLGIATYEGGIVTGRRAKSAYLMKRAIRFEDPELARNYMIEYMSTFMKENKDKSYTITQKGVDAYKSALKQSLRMRSPFGMMKKDDLTRVRLDDNPGFLFAQIPEDQRKQAAKDLGARFLNASHEQKIKMLLALKQMPQALVRNVERAESYYSQYLSDPVYKSEGGRASGVSVDALQSAMDAKGQD